MDIPLFQVDAFATKLFEGNPAAVCPLKEWLPDELLQKIALENNLSETAFFVQTNRLIAIRWFTPTTEVELCGHATLAAAHVLSKHLGFQGDVIEFDSLSGRLSVQVNEVDYTLNFPTDQITPLPSDHPVVSYFDLKPQAVFKGKSDFLLAYRLENEVRQIKVDTGRLANFEGRGVIVTSPSDKYDFISRCFYPQSGVNEDPATGSAHTTLAVYWASQLGKSHFSAHQVSKRGGSFELKLEGDRVFITGKAHTFLTGNCRL